MQFSTHGPMNNKEINCSLTSVISSSAVITEQKQTSVLPSLRAGSLSFMNYEGDVRLVKERLSFHTFP